MNNLGIAYRLTDSNGGKGYDAYTLTENFTGSWTSVVADEREIWFQYGLENYNGIAVTLVSDGIVLTASELTHGTRPTDNKTIWVFVPSVYNVSDSQWDMIINEMRRIVKQSELPAKASFAPLLGIDLTSRRFNMNLTPSDIRRENQRMAFRVATPQYSIPTILQGINQSYYASYKHLFLYPQRPGQLPVGTDDLTDNPIQLMNIILPPAPDAISRAFGRNDVELFIGDSRFTKPITLPSTSKMFAITARRRGFEPMNIQGLVQENEAPCALAGIAPQWSVAIHRNTIRISDAATKRDIAEQHTMIRINEQPLLPNRPIIIPEADLNSIRIAIRANGYEDFNETVSYQQFASAIRLKPKESAITSRIRLEDNNGDERQAHVTISGKQLNYLPQQDVTLRISGGRVTQITSPFNKGLIYGILGTIATFLIGWGIYVGINAIFGSDTYTDTDRETDAPIVKQAQDSNPNINQDPAEKAFAEARNYLNDSCKTEQRDFVLKYEKLNRYADLPEVYKNINTFNLPALEKSPYKDCAPVYQAIAALKICKENNIDPKKEIGEQYSNDGSITLSKYIEALEKLKGTQPNNNPVENPKKNSTEAGSASQIATTDKTARIADLQTKIQNQEQYISNLNAKISALQGVRSKQSELEETKAKLDKAKKDLESYKRQLEQLQ